MATAVPTFYMAEVSYMGFAWDKGVFRVSQYWQPVFLIQLFYAKRTMTKWHIIRIPAKLFFISKF